jgi:multidrug efflux system membrane fusion protein
VLAKIDPVTYQAQLDQAVAKKALDEALLANTKHDLERFQKVGTLAISQQQIDTQVALIKQQEAQVKSDVASIENAQAILDYTTIVAPFGGRTGIRLVDEGNLVHANDTAGIVVITQVQPITAVFTLPQQDLPTVTKAIAEGSLTAQALSTDSQTELDVGVLKVIDNQVDQQTGTIRLKAEFPNEKRQLWPGQFVNVRLLVDTLKGVTVAPTEAVQRGPDGTYVFVVNEDKTVAMRNVKVSRQDEKYAVIADGLKAGETVVTSGFARLKDGSKVSVSDGSSAPQDAQPQHHRKSPDARKSAAAETNALAVPPATEAALVTGSTPADGTRSGKHRHHRDNGQSP